MRAITYLLSIQFIFIIMNTNCSNVQSEKMIPDPPVSYQPTAMGIRDITHIKGDVDSLRLFSRPYASNDKTIKMDYIFSIIELYDKTILYSIALRNRRQTPMM